MSEQQNTPTPWSVNAMRLLFRDAHNAPFWDSMVDCMESDGRSHPAMRTEHDEYDARLCCSSTAGIVNAAHRLGMDPLTLAERLEDGGIAELVAALANCRRVLTRYRGALDVDLGINKADKALAAIYPDQAGRAEENPAGD